MVFTLPAGPRGEALTNSIAKSLAGQRICKNGEKFALVEVRADWAYHKDLFRFRSSWKGGAKHGVCFQCPAMATGPLHEQYYNFDDAAPFWSQQYTLAQFIANELPDRDPCD